MNKAVTNTHMSLSEHMYSFLLSEFGYLELYCLIYKQMKFSR